MKITITLNEEAVKQIALGQGEKLEELTDYIKSLCDSMCCEPIDITTSVEE